jgi:hypothetical protein
MGYQFIEPLTEKPKMKRRMYMPTSISEMIIREFENSGARYAKVSFDKVKGIYKSPGSCARAMGRTLNKLRLKGKIQIYSDEVNIYLEKVK